MSAMSDYLENKLVDFLFRGGAFTAPASIYIGLLTAAPSDTGGGTEVTGGSYARQSVAPGTSTWKSTQDDTTATSTGTSGTTKNASTVTFPTATANWGTVTHVGIYDAVSGGNLLFWGALTSSKTVNSGDIFSFAAGELQVQLDN